MRTGENKKQCSLKRTKRATVFFIYYIVECERMAYDNGFGLYSLIKILKLKNIHIPHIGVTKSYRDWVFKIPVTAAIFNRKPI